ncbi:MAG: DMT family transporter, partial [Duncaniella sp.]|nr:DMT family transporter [Duncaniella sp.]
WIAVGALGVLMAVSAIGLFESDRWMNSGVASTLLFIYPVMVAVMMVVFYKERLKMSLVVCLVVMGFGLWMLIRQEPGMELSVYGCLLVLLSALTYAFYIIMVNVSERVRDIPTTRLLFYVLLSGCCVFALALLWQGSLAVPTHATGWINLVCLALVPTVISLVCTTRAIQLIGSTPTAILGALEPVAAVVLSVVVLHQTLTGREIFGGVLIVLAATIVIAGESVDKALLRMRKMWPRKKVESGE